MKHRGPIRGRMGQRMTSVRPLICHPKQHVEHCSKTNEVDHPLYTYSVCTWVGDQIIDRDLTGGLRTTEAEWYDKSEEDKVLEEQAPGVPGSDGKYPEAFFSFIMT
jgi:hypothetical protein